AGGEVEYSDPPTQEVGAEDAVELGLGLGSYRDRLRDRHPISQRHFDLGSAISVRSLVTQESLGYERRHLIRHRERPARYLDRVAVECQPSNGVREGQRLTCHREGYSRDGRVDRDDAVLQECRVEIPGNRRIPSA